MYTNTLKFQLSFFMKYQSFHFPSPTHQVHTSLAAIAKTKQRTWYEEDRTKYKEDTKEE